jgi:hypothetical protein
MTPDEITEYHNRAREAWWATYEQWIADFNASGFDASRLPIAETTDSYVGHELRNLRQAVDAADVIVVGGTKKISWLPHRGLIEFEIERRMKGAQLAPADSLPLLISGGPYPGPDLCFKTAGLISHPPAPLLFPGDRAVLFLEMQPTGALKIQAYSGEYLIEDGQIRALEWNKFKDDVDGLTLDAFVRLIRSYLDP